MYNRHHIAARIQACGITLRAWQRQALILATATDCPDLSLIVAIMGAGKSVVLSLLAASWQGPVVVSVPSVDLVAQLRETLRRMTGETVGVWYGDEKDRQRITIVCVPSHPAFAAVHGHIDNLLWIADEAHTCEVASIDPFLDTCHPTRSIGVTATPYLADKPLTRWKHVLFRYSLEDAIADGALVPFRVDFATGQGPDGVDDRTIDWLRATAAIGPAVVSAADIADADAFAVRCAESGIRSASLHSRSGKRNRARSLAALQSGDIDVIVHCHMLSEGIDMPWLRRLGLRQPRGSRKEFAQEIGRVLRASEGKEYALVYDPFQVTLKHSLQTAAELGDAIERADAGEPKPPPPLSIDPETGEPFVWDDLPAKEQRRALIVSDAAGYLASCVVALRNDAVIESPPGPGEWRFGPASPAQLQVLGRMEPVLRWLRSESFRPPGVYRDDAPLVQGVSRAYSRIYADAIKRGRTPRKGPCSDLITCLFAIANGKVALQPDPPIAEKTNREAWARAKVVASLRRYAVDPTALLSD